jgi:putative phosphoesterase
VNSIRIGLISDTHDLVRPEAKRALAGVERIIHAGDICSAAVLAELGEIAPVTAVRGNNDRGAWAHAIPLTQSITIGTVLVHVIHNIDELEQDPATAGFHAVVYGHSHRPLVERRHGVLFVNPGSAGPRRFTLPVSVGVIEIANGMIAAKLYRLDHQPTGESK